MAGRRPEAAFVRFLSYVAVASSTGCTRHIRSGLQNSVPEHEGAWVPRSYLLAVGEQVPHVLDPVLDKDEGGTLTRGLLRFLDHQKPLHYRSACQRSQWSHYGRMVSYDTMMPRSARRSSTSRKLRPYLWYNHTAWLKIADGRGAQGRGIVEGAGIVPRGELT